MPQRKLSTPGQHRDTLLMSRHKLTHAGTLSGRREMAMYVGSDQFVVLHETNVPGMTTNYPSIKDLVAHAIN